MTKNIITLKAELTVLPHEQTVMSDYPIEFDTYNTVVKTKLITKLKEEFEHKLEQLPLDIIESFDNHTHHYHYQVEMYLITKEIKEALITPVNGVF